MNQKKKTEFFLRWPWNVLVCILLVVALGIFSIPVILLLMKLQRSGNPHGAAEGYCLSRTRKQLPELLWALLMLLISAALGVYFYSELQQRSEYRELSDYTNLIAAGVGAAAMLLLGLYTAWCSVRDTFFPARSALAKSIRGQLPYPEEAPPVEELFAMVDRDLKEHGQWFDAVGIGREWVLGDAASRIDRIRAIFTVDRIRHHHSQTGIHTNRILELVLIDDRWQKAVTFFKRPDEMQAAADYLSLRVPEAVRGRNDGYSRLLAMDDVERDRFERDFRQRQALRASKEAGQNASHGLLQDMILQQPDGSVTSRVTSSLVREALQRCLSGEGGFLLTPTRPIAGNGQNFLSLRCVSASEGRRAASGKQNSAAESGIPPEHWRRRAVLTVETASPDGGGHRFMTMETDRQRAEELLEGWLRRQTPDLDNPFDNWHPQTADAGNAGQSRRGR